MKYSVLATTGAVVGGAHSAGAADEPAESESSPVPGVMFPYQFTPGAPFTVVETDLDWRPGSLESDYRSHVIEYDHARSLRAFLFIDAERTLPYDQPLAFASTQRSAPIATDRSLVGIEVESIDTR